MDVCCQGWIFRYHDIALYPKWWYLMCNANPHTQANIMILNSWSLFKSTFVVCYFINEINSFSFCGMPIIRLYCIFIRDNIFNLYKHSYSLRVPTRFETKNHRVHTSVNGKKHNAPLCAMKETITYIYVYKYIFITGRNPTMPNTKL